MPTNFVKSPADEKKWVAAKAKAAEQGHKEDWPYTTSIFNSMKGKKKEPGMNAKLGTQKAAIHPAAISGAVSHAIPMIDMLHSRARARRAGADSDVPLEEVFGAALMGGGALPFLATKMFGTPSDEDIEAQSRNKWVNFLPLVGGIRLSRRLKKMKNDARLLEEARTMERYRNKTSAAALDANALNHLNMLSGLGNANPGIASAINPTPGMTAAPRGDLQASLNLPNGKANATSQAPAVKGASWVRHLEKIAGPKAEPKPAPIRPGRKVRPVPEAPDYWGVKPIDPTYPGAGPVDMSYLRGLLNPRVRGKKASWEEYLEKIAVDPRGRTRNRPHKAPARPAPEPRPQTDGRNEFLSNTKRKNTLSQPQPDQSGPSLSSIGNDIETVGRSYLGQAAGQGADFFNEVARRRDAILNDAYGTYRSVAEPVERFGSNVDRGLGVVGDFATDTYNDAGDAIQELRNIFG